MILIDNSSILKSWIKVYKERLAKAEKRKDFKAIEEYKKHIRDLQEELKNGFRI